MPFDPDQYLKDQGYDPDAQVSSPAAAFASALGTAAEAAPQGVLDIPESIYQWGEKAGLPRPTGPVADWLRQYRNWAGSTGPGQVGETVGNVAGFMAGGEAADALGLAARVPGAVTRLLEQYPRWATTLKTGAQSTIARPTDSTSLPDFLKQKAEDFGLGAILGRILGRPIQRAAHDEVADANKDSIAQHAADVANTRQANEIAARVARQDTATDVETVRRANEAQTARHQANVSATRQANAADIAAARQANKADAETHARVVATEKEQHQALSEAQQAHHDQIRQQAQDTADELTRRREAALESRRQKISSNRAVPEEATASWWKRTAAKIGVDIPGAATPETAATVRNLVGARLNELTDRMHLDPADTSLTDQLAEIRRQTTAKLQGHNQGGFFTQPQPSPLGGLVHSADPNAPPGTMIPRTAAAAPPPPSGMWADQVLDPLKKGPLTGRALTEYISRLGNKANELADRARSLPQAERADLEAQAAALRQAQDAVIGHAAGSPEDKLAIEQARQAYMLWGAGDDAAKARRSGVASPAQLIDAMTKRLGEARYKDALINPANPFHETVTWLQGQLGRIERVPSVDETTASIPRPPRLPPARPTPIPPPSPRTAPTPRPMPTPRPLPTPPTPIAAYPPRRATVLPEPSPPTPRTGPAMPNYPRRNIPSSLAQIGGGAGLMHMGHPGYGGALIGSGLRGLARRSGGEEGSLERAVRRQITNRPRTVGRAAQGTASSVGGQAEQLRRRAEQTPEDVARAVQALSNMYYRWGSGQ
jgi:hypothetical protein